MNEIQIEEYIFKNALNHVMRIDRIKKLIDTGSAEKYDIEKIVLDSVKRARSGNGGGTRMRASDVIEFAESAVRQRYKGVKLERKRERKSYERKTEPGRQLQSARTPQAQA